MQQSSQAAGSVYESHLTYTKSRGAGDKFTSLNTTGSEWLGPATWFWFNEIDLVTVTAIAGPLCSWAVEQPVVSLGALESLEGHCGGLKCSISHSIHCPSCP
jgi:hypothetical protein